MEAAERYLPQYHSTVVIGGAAYEASLSLPTGRRETAGEAAHSHAQYELHALAEGRATVCFGGEPEPDLDLGPGDCCLIAPHVYHLRRLGRETVKCYVLSIHCRDVPLKLDGAFRLLACGPQVLLCLQALERELRSPGLGADGCIRSLLTLLLTQILRELAGGPGPSGQERVPVRQREDMIDHYFALHYQYDISAGDLARRIGVTTRQLARIMQQQYGCTFRQRLLEIRLYHAGQLLAATDRPVSRIAAECGFTDQGAFATAFKKHTGQTPSQYRAGKQGRGGEK